MDDDLDLDLVREELRERAEELIGPERPRQVFGAYVCLPSDPTAELARFVERRVFLEAFENSPDLLTTEYASYEEASVFIVVLDHERLVPAGMMRIVLPSAAGLKSLHDLEPGWGVSAEEAMRRVDDAWNPVHMWDFATLAVNPEYRGQAALGLVTQGLVQTLTQVALRLGLLRYVAILDLPVLRLLQWKIGRPFAEYPGVGPRPYLGSPASVPVWGDLARWDATLAAHDDVMHQIMFAGRGLEAVLCPPDWDRAAARVGALIGTVSRGPTPAR